MSNATSASPFPNITNLNFSFELCTLPLYVISLFFDTVLGQVFFSFSLSSVFAFFFAFCSIFLCLKGCYSPYLSLPLVLSLLLLLILAICEFSIHQSSIFNHYYRAYFLNILFCCLLYINFANNLPLFKFCMKLIYVSGLIFSFLTCIGLFIDVSSTARVTLFGFNENYLGFFLLFPLLLSSLYYFRENFNLFTSITLTVPLFSCLVLTGTRSAYMAFVISLVFIFTRFFSDHLLRKRLIIYFLTLVLSCFLVSLSIFPLFHKYSFFSQLFTSYSFPSFTNPHIFDRLVLSESTSPLQLGGRLQLWMDSLHLSRQNHFLGSGFTVFNSTNNNFHLPHNIIFEILVVGGIVALIFLLIIFFYSLFPIPSLNNPLALITYISLLAPVLISPLFINISYFKFFWLFYALFLSYRFHLKRGAFS